MQRAKLEIDKLSHFNNVTFEVYRDIESDVNEDDLHVMNVDETVATKMRKVMTGEQLLRDPETPYVFYSTRHFETDPQPMIYLGEDLIPSNEVKYYPDDKMIEIHNVSIGLGDTRNVYMTYEYTFVPVLDDATIENGKEYFGPSASGLRPPLDLAVTHHPIANKIEITYNADLSPIVYFYRIRAKDTDGSYSPFSLTKHLQIQATDVRFQIQRSEDKEKWMDIAETTDTVWFDGVYTPDKPNNLKNIKVTPLNSKESKIELDNPWITWQSDPRISNHYRIRVIDAKGEVSEWVQFDPFYMYVPPKELLIRRKVDDGSQTTRTDTDAVDVHAFVDANVDQASGKISWIDDQLTDVTKYRYTFFYTDVLDMSHKILEAVSDHTPWLNIIAFVGETKTDVVDSKDFITMFEFADKVIEIGS